MCGDGGGQDPPGAAGGGCGEAGLRVHGATGDEHRTDCARKVWTKSVDKYYCFKGTES